MHINGDTFIKIKDLEISKIYNLYFYNAFVWEGNYSVKSWDM